MALQLPWVPAGGTPCCCEVCCMYPWPDPSGTPLYPDTDLPDTVKITTGSGTVTKTRNAGEYTYGDTGLTGGVSVSSVEYWDSLLEEFIPLTSWAVLLDGQQVLGASPCLIAGYPILNVAPFVEDEFLDVYHFTFDAGNGPIEYTLTRQSLCYWQVSAVGHNASPGGYEGLYYESFIPYAKETATPPYNLCWVLTFVDDNGDFQGEFVKDDPQSSPEGDYGAFITVIP